MQTPFALSRRPARYTRLAAASLVGGEGADATGSFEIVLDTAGHLDRIEGEEGVRLVRPDGTPAFDQKTRLEVELRSIAQVEPKDDALARRSGLVRTGMSDVSASPRLERDLQQYPERCRDLVELFRSPAMNRRARTRILDLLVATGNAEAQAVLRELLETREARGSDHYELLVQRLSLLEAPTQETVDYLRTKVESDGDDSMAAAHSLGSAIGRRSILHGEVDPASAALLRRGLAASAFPEQVDWIATLGNAGLAEDVPVLAPYSESDEPSVRAAVADALRKMQVPASEEILHRLVLDPDARVQKRALRTLAGYALAAEDLERLRRGVAAGEVQAGSFAELVALLENHRHAPGATASVLDAMLGRPIADRRLSLRIQAFRSSLSSSRARRAP